MYGFNHPKQQQEGGKKIPQPGILICNVVAWNVDVTDLSVSLILP